MCVIHGALYVKHEACIVPHMFNCYFDGPLWINLWVKRLEALQTMGNR